MDLFVVVVYFKSDFPKQGRYQTFEIMVMKVLIFVRTRLKFMKCDIFSSSLQLTKLGRFLSINVKKFLHRMRDEDHIFPFFFFLVYF